MKLQLGKLEIEVKEFPFKLYDKDGKVRYCRNEFGLEYWTEYDKDGNETYYRNSDGYEFWKEYDENGNQTHYRDSTGYEWGTPRSRSCEGKIVEIEGKKYRLKEVK